MYNLAGHKAPRLFIDGYPFWREKISGNRVAWKCVNSYLRKGSLNEKCKCRVTTVNGVVMLHNGRYSKFDHNH